MMLNRLNPKLTKQRSPGPGAIKKVDWKPFADKHLKGTNVILHTDGARTYMMKVDGVIHDNVVHKKKQIKLKSGRKIWVNPKYVRVISHKLPGIRKRLKVKAGTQIIDRAWAHFHAFLKYRGGVGSDKLMRRIRLAQWAYWYSGLDLWAKTGEMLKHMQK